MNATPSPRRLVILPSYNSGPQLARTLAAVAAVWTPVWAVIDGSTDESGRLARDLAIEGTRIIELATNSGKGGAVFEALKLASAEGFDHALVMDADGQHPPEAVAEFMALSEELPHCLIAGTPVFGPDAPGERVTGRRVGNTLASIETLGRGARDSLFGFRVYPIAPVLRILSGTRSARRFDFDTVVAVRLAWAGVPTVNRPVPVRYPPREEGGVSHFHYVRDNLLLTRVHTGLLLEMWRHLPTLLSLPCH